jgi:hypothetical protein
MKFSEQLHAWVQEAVEREGTSKFAANCGIDRSQLAAFLGGYRKLSLDAIDRLMDHLFPGGYPPVAERETINRLGKERPDGGSPGEDEPPDLDDGKPFIY